ncbi:DUF1648 domain-containing protein [Anaerosalibacter sp. Marseille-P3206]|uniref:DUF1648 domain-containing protein n=1 Tax=Anaerosalibacter sp. Marseille-P3206 TaxID=1871005 RepID=UPI000984A13E|nr:DUF5808 domain-containing protein [Anaerosalibacter sp. Marseille-P3206]
MEDRVYIVIMNLFFYMIMLILQIFMPKVTRKNIYFGIRIPEEEVNSFEVKNIYKNYVIENIIVSIPSIALLSYWAYITDNIVVTASLPIFIYIGILFIVYLRANSKMKKLKEVKSWEKPKEEVVVDIKFSKEKIKAGNVSSLWFLIPVGIALLNLVVGLNKIPTLPDKIPTNWDLQGNITGYMDKTKFAWFMPLTQLGTAGILFFVYKVIGWSKQEISSKNPEESVKRNIIFRRVWSIYTLVMGIVLNIIMTLASFYSLGIIGGSVNTITNLFFIFTILIIVASIIISIKVGQGGSRLKFNSENGYEEMNRDDDEFWKLGNTIYYNPDDPTLFIEKRFGVGWTVNVGRPLGMLFMILPFIIVIITLIMVK